MCCWLTIRQSKLLRPPQGHVHRLQSDQSTHDTESRPRQAQHEVQLQNIDHSKCLIVRDIDLLSAVGGPACGRIPVIIAQYWCMVRTSSLSLGEFVGSGLQVSILFPMDTCAFMS